MDSRWRDRFLGRSYFCGSAAASLYSLSRSLNNREHLLPHATRLRRGSSAKISSSQPKERNTKARCSISLLLDAVFPAPPTSPAHQAEGGGQKDCPISRGLGRGTYFVIKPAVVIAGNPRRCKGRGVAGEDDAGGTGIPGAKRRAADLICAAERAGIERACGVPLGRHGRPVVHRDRDTRVDD